MSERHVVPEYLHLSSILNYLRERVVGESRLDALAQLDVSQLRSTNNMLLLFRRKPIPTSEIMKIFLDDNVATASERRVLICYESGVYSGLSLWVLSPVDEPDKVAAVKISEPVNLVYRTDCESQPSHYLRCELETEVHPLSTNMKENIAGR